MIVIAVGFQNLLYVSKNEGENWTQESSRFQGIRQYNRLAIVVFLERVTKHLAFAEAHLPMANIKTNPPIYLAHTRDQR